MQAKRRKVTLSDIASALNLSKATVSLAINGDPRVAAETRSRVAEKVAELGYVYNRGAAGLSTGRSNSVGLAVHDITNPYFAEVCKQCEAVLAARNRLAFLSSTRESLDHQQRFIRTLIEHQGDGLILSPADGTTRADLQPIFSAGLPTVLIARYVEGAELDFVGNDDFFAFSTITRHLLKLGHRRIAMVGGGQSASVSHDRRRGFLQTMQEHGLSVSPELLIDSDTSPQGGETAYGRLEELAEPVSAVIAFTDLIGVGLLSAMHRRGLEPGRDMAVVSCDDIEEADRGYTQLTTIRTRKGEIGRRSAELLLRRIAHHDAPVEQIRLKGELIVRRSCGAHNFSSAATTERR